MLTDSLMLIALDKASEIVTVDLKDGTKKVQRFSMSEYYQFEVFYFSETNLICFLLDSSDTISGRYLKGYFPQEYRTIVYF